MVAVRRAVVGIVAWAGLIPVATGTPATTMALMSGSANGTANTLAGATFSPLSIAAPTVNLVTGIPRVVWNQVSISSGVPVSYAVVRSVSGGGSGAACPAASLSSAGGQVTCDDSAATGGATYSYTVQPYLDRGGTVTWTRPVSGTSNQVSIPRLTYGGVGPASLFSGGSPNTVVYPTGTVAGDVLVMIARNARNKQIVPPTGWTTLTSQTNGSPASAFMVAWRVADAATSTTIAINSSNDGAVAWVIRYVRTSGVTATPVLATAAVVWSESTTTTASFAATGLLGTSTGYATVVTIASTITGQIPGLVSGTGYASQTGVSASSAGSTFSMATADQLAITSGSQVASPTWSVGTATNTWQALTIAFA